MEKKKKMIFEIVASQPLEQAWTYKVEAESYEEAIEMIENGDVEHCDDFEYYNYGDIDYELLTKKPVKK